MELETIEIEEMMAYCRECNILEKTTLSQCYRRNKHEGGTPKPWTSKKTLRRYQVAV